MGFHIIRNSLSDVKADALVNPTSTQGTNIGGVEAKLFEQGGKLLEKARLELGVIHAGNVRYTDAFNLDAAYVFHTVGPTWQGGHHHEFNVLRNCYENCLHLAKALQLESIAFPLIASGTFGFPKAKALSIAIETIKNFHFNEDITVYLVVYDKESYALSKSRFHEVKSYIDTHEEYNLREVIHTNKFFTPKDLDEAMLQTEATFSETLLDTITKLEKEDHEIYKKANIDRKHFSKIRSNKHYQPSKNTAVALGIALEFDLDTFLDFIAKAGYTLSPSSMFDLIIRYFLENHIYDLFDINATLFAFTNKTL